MASQQADLADAAERHAAQAEALAAAEAAAQASDAAAAALRRSLEEAQEQLPALKDTITELTNARDEAIAAQRSAETGKRINLLR